MPNATRYHVPVTVEGRTDGLIVSQYHFTSRYEAVTYSNQINARPPYKAEAVECNDPECKDFDRTAEVS